MPAASDWFRARRNRHLRGVIASLAGRKDGLRVLDLGGRPEYWNQVGLDFLRQSRVFIDIVNLRASDLTIGEGRGGDIMRNVVGNACELDYADNAYDLCHSNSVIEHVGSFSAMEAFAREVRRVAPAYYIQTPNFWFPIDPHFPRMPLFHWLPLPTRARLLQHFRIHVFARKQDTVGSAFRLAETVSMLNRRQVAYLFPDAAIHAERIALLAKSFTAVRIHAGGTD